MTKTRIAFLLTAVLSPLAAQAETLTLDQCVGVALKENPEIAGSNYEVEVAVAKKNQARSGYSPRLKLDAGIQRWDKEMSSPLFGLLYGECTNCQWATNPQTQQPSLFDPIMFRPPWA